MGVVGGHVGDVRRVLVHGRLRGMWLQSLRDAVEVKFVGIPLAVHFGHNVFIIVVSEGPAQLVIVHLGLALPAAPEAGHLIGVLDDELPVLSLLPGDDMAELLLLQQLQDEVPQLDLPGARGRLGLVGPVRKLIPFNVKRGRCGESGVRFTHICIPDLILQCSESLERCVNVPQTPLRSAAADHNRGEESMETSPFLWRSCALLARDTSTQCASLLPLLHY